MILKCRKIRGIDKNVCTCEQKIAYNYAFAWKDTYLRRTKGTELAILKSIALSEIIDFIVKDIKRNEKMQKYNIDAIIISFRNGFLSYCEKPFIPTDYNIIGEVFNIPYDIK